MRKLHRFLIPFTLFWSACVLVFDAACVRNLAGQWRSRSFIPATATILASAVETHQSDSTTYGAAIRYEYRVAGRRYESDRVRHGQGSDSDGRWARRIVAENPAGATRTIWHDPADPAAAVIERGIGGQDLFLALFLTPFNAIMAVLWSFFITSWRPVPPAGGARISTGTDRIEVWYAGIGPGYVALAAAGGMAFILIFVIGFSGGFFLSVGPVAAAWGAVGLAGLAGFFASRQRNRRARPDLVISAAAGTLTLAESAAVIPFEHVRSVAVRERVTPSTDGQSVSLVVVLLAGPPATAESTEHDLGTWWHPARAEAFAAWLRATLGLNS